MRITGNQYALLYFALATAMKVLPGYWVLSQSTVNLMNVSLLLRVIILDLLHFGVVLKLRDMCFIMY
jgi:c-di-AMP phosphodiesterase-like protein